MPDPIITIKPVGWRPKEFAAIKRECLATVYNKMNSGEYVAVKDGKRTLIISPDPHDTSNLQPYEPGHEPESLRLARGRQPEEQTAAE